MQEALKKERNHQSSFYTSLLTWMLPKIHVNYNGLLVSKIIKVIATFYDSLESWKQAK